MEILSFVLSYAITYIATLNDYSTPVAVNWTSINATTWWGSGPASAQDISVRKADITWDANMITDLKKRLTRNVSYVAPLENVAFNYGFNRDQLANWTSYWATKYNFTARLKALNKFPMYKTNIQGLDIQYIRVTPKGEDDLDIVPMLMLHGYPGSPREFFDVIPLLTEITDGRDYAIELIVPFLPGFGYSQYSNKTGFGAAQYAVVMNSLMQRLGFSKYYVQGGDFGAIIGSHMATLFPDNILGYHTNWGQVMSPIAVGLQILGSVATRFVVEDSLKSRMYPVYDIFSNTMKGLAYLHWQATKPETAGVALSSSPAGLLAYVLEHWMRVTDTTTMDRGDGGLYSHFSQDVLIDNLMMYWATNHITSAFRLYAATYNKAHFANRLDEIQTTVPTYVVQDLYEVYYQSPLILKLKFVNLLETEVLTKGGHFMALELPREFADSVFTAIDAFRDWHDDNEA